jgi:hypothetical protein
MLALTLPNCSACPPVNLFIAAFAMFMPLGAVSMASTLIVLPLYVTA